MANDGLVTVAVGIDDRRKLFRAKVGTRFSVIDSDRKSAGIDDAVAEELGGHWSLAKPRDCIEPFASANRYIYQRTPSAVVMPLISFLVLSPTLVGWNQ